jgi:DNA-binding CsgD family transcriptional regulator
LNAEITAAYMKAQEVSPALFPMRGRIGLLLLEGGWAEAKPLIIERYAARVNYANALQACEWVARLARAQGETERAWEAVHRVLLPEGPAAEPGDVFFVTTLEIMCHAIALATDAGDLDTARAWLETHDRWLAWSGATAAVARSALGWAVFYRACGEAMRASEYACRALQHASKPRQPLALVDAHRLIGELKTAARCFPEAATHLDAALALATACAAPFERALTLFAQAELHAACGERQAALGLLDEVRAICTPLGAKPTLARVEALAAQLAGWPTRAAAHPAGLTARQVEILRLVAAGKTDREIAAALHLSVRTVSNHIAHILTKTDTENRAAAVAFAMRHGIA